MPIQRPRLPDELAPEPLELVSSWLDDATSVSAIPNAMVLATVDERGSPSARVVLCKELRPRPGYATFFTNYSSRKGLELSANARAAAVLYWEPLRRQVRLEGAVRPTSAAESDAYFASRPWQARLGAWASAQSTPIASRAQLTQAVEDAAQRFGVPSPLASDDDAADPGAPIPRPPCWGGYRLWIDAVELWMDGTARLHDRARWQRSLRAVPAGFEPGPWTATRLHP